MGDRYDVVIVGAGPAGLSAALVLGRACRRVLICDRGTPRSWAAKRMHAFLSREGIEPQAFRNVAREELSALGNVDYREAEVTAVARVPDDSFTVSFHPCDSDPIECNEKAITRKLLIATGVFDRLPCIEGIEPLFGKSVFECPYCDGWEFRDQAVMVYGKHQRGFEMARAMTAWSSDIVLCADGPSGFDLEAREQLRKNGIRLNEVPIDRLVGHEGQLERIVFANGETLQRSVLFFDAPSREQSHLAAQLGCQFTEHGTIKCGEYEATSVPGVFAAGNIIQDVQLSIVAAAEGARAAFGINRSLTREAFERNANA